MPTLLPELEGWLLRAAARGLIPLADIPGMRDRLLADRDRLARLAVPERQPPAPIDDALLYRAALEIVQLVRPRSTVAGKPIGELLAIILAWKLRTLRNVHEDVQTAHEERHGRLAAMLLAGTIPLALWHREMQRSVTLLATKQALLGGRGEINQRARVKLSQVIASDSAYLGRFADEIAARDVTGQPMTEDAIRARANLYTGPARGLFYRGIEESARESMRGPDAGAGFGLPRHEITGADPEEGWVVEYIAKDDDRTCSACHDAQGWYFPGEGPMPGEVCAGRAHCRCVRELRYDLDAWRVLRDRLPLAAAG